MSITIINRPRHRYPSTPTPLAKDPPRRTIPATGPTGLAGEAQRLYPQDTATGRMLREAYMAGARRHRGDGNP